MTSKAGYLARKHKSRYLTATELSIHLLRVFMIKDYIQAVGTSQIKGALPTADMEESQERGNIFQKKMLSGPRSLYALSLFKYRVNRMSKT